MPVKTLFILRLLCSAIVIPEVYGVIKGSPTFILRKRLVCISKVFQNLANDRAFPEDSEYEIYNYVIVNKKRNFDVFVSHLITLVSLNSPLGEMNREANCEDFHSIVSASSRLSKWSSVRGRNFFGDCDTIASVDDSGLWSAAEISEWTTADVCGWLILNGLEEYRDIFLDEEIDGSAFLDLTERDLKVELKVTKIGHRKKITRFIENANLRPNLSNKSKPKTLSTSTPRTKSYSPLHAESQKAHKSRTIIYEGYNNCLEKSSSSGSLSSMYSAPLPSRQSLSCGKLDTIVCTSLKTFSVDAGVKSTRPSTSSSSLQKWLGRLPSYD